MMLPTHALLGMLLALPVAVLAPEHASVALAAGLVGGILPDLDLYAGHRKTLHYPVGYSLLAGVATLAAVVSPSPATVGAVVLFAAAASHSLVDVLGGGLELRPWEASDERAVYDHYRGRWIAPRRWVRYDGAPEDLLLSVGLALPLWLHVAPPFRRVVAASIVVAVTYAATRRALPRVARALVTEVLPGRVPASLLARLPERYVEDAGRDGSRGGV
ncbi:metal-dependent hydrolase [Halolamina sp. CBA1230]|uniref:metal-dependent hydrolase n=1 Tax=Halolamina sp. CBA1230 TaxID=1853690 RepID=UPI0009A194FE|nr:metal-dependent hydrolase [Halolamina sp. CBA1230]QKY20017.1 metal-dependent hydrolase [Halolamina sp. CBA1230]